MTGEDPFHLAQEVAARHGSQGGANTQSPSPENGAEIVQLPLWGPDYYGAPVSLLRSSLFGVVQRGRRAYYEDTKITAWRGVSISYTGPRLDQADEDVWCQILQLHQEQEAAGLGVRFEVSIKSLLKELGRANGKSNKEWLRKSLLRLTASAVSVKTQNVEYAGSLVDEFIKDENSGRYIVSVNPRLATLFKDGWSRLEKEQRLALGQDQTSKWLHSFIATHRANSTSPLHMTFKALQDLSGSDCERRRFKATVRESLKKLHEKGVIKQWMERDSKVTIWKPKA